MKIGARITRLDDLTDEDVDAWRHLAAGAVEPNVFFEPEFLLEFWTHLYSGLEAPLVDPADVSGAVGALLGVRARRHRPAHDPAIA